jgi:hypothetical protein
MERRINRVDKHHSQINIEPRYSFEKKVTNEDLKIWS